MVPHDKPAAALTYLNIYLAQLCKCFRIIYFNMFSSKIIQNKITSI